MGTSPARPAPAATPADTVAAERRILAIVGPTGTGKSKLSLDVAEALAKQGTVAEIVNADAMQLYRGMDIGTAKLPVAERRGIAHHLLDELAVTEEGTVAWYQPRARAAIAEILARGRLPILVGGSGLYVSSVLFDFRFPGTNAVVRARLEQEASLEGPAGMYKRLRERDPDAAASIGPHNVRRLVRALEVVEITGDRYSASLPEVPTPWLESQVVGLSSPRAELVGRLDRRVLRMWDAGILEEVSGLIEAGIERGVTASRAIGYAQAIGQLHGELTQAEAIERSQQLTRRYARRQVGWFQRYPGLEWIDSSEPSLVRTVLDRL